MILNIVFSMWQGIMENRFEIEKIIRMVFNR